MAWGGHGKGAATQPSWKDVCLQMIADGGLKGDGGKGGAPAGKGKGKGKSNGTGGAKGEPKGKGKGKSDAKEKGKGKGKGKEAWWPCPNPKCETLMGKVWHNAPTLCECGQCGSGKAAAQDSWVAQRNALRAEVAAEAAGGAAAATKPAAKAAAQKPPAPSAAAAEEKEDEQMWEESADDDDLPLTDEYIAIAQMQRSPRPFSDEWSAEKSMKFGDSSGQKVAVIQESIAKCKTVLALEGAELGDGVTIDFAAVKKRLASLEKEATKAADKTPGAELTACELRLAKQRFVDAEKASLNFAIAGSHRAAERQVRMEEICAEKMAAWEVKLHAIKEEETLRAAAWQERRAELFKRKSEVIALYDAKIQAADTLAGAVTKAESATVAEKEKEAEENKEKEAKRIAAQVKADEEKAAKAETTKARYAAVDAFKQLEVTAQVASEDLPDLTVAPEAAKDAVVVLSTMFCWMRASALGESHLPFAFSEMGATAAIAQCLAGEVTWNAFFKGAAVTDATICPMQLRQIIFLQLATYENSLQIKKQVEQETEARRVLEDAEPRLKRLRTLIRPWGK